MKSSVALRKKRIQDRRDKLLLARAAVRQRAIRFGMSDIRFSWHATVSCGVGSVVPCRSLRMFRYSFQRFLEGLAKTCHGVSMEAPRRGYRQPSLGSSVFVVVFDPGGITLVSHGVGQGLTPIRSRKSRTTRTWYRFASLVGCGRWNVPTSPFDRLLGKTVEA